MVTGWVVALGFRESGSQMASVQKDSSGLRLWILSVLEDMESGMARESSQQI